MRPEFLIRRAAWTKKEIAYFELAAAYFERYGRPDLGVQRREKIAMLRRQIECDLTTAILPRRDAA
jgi:hypothetical protein